MPEWLSEYDLVAPYTAFALARLRTNFPKWMIHRQHRARFMLPLIYGSTPGESSKSLGNLVRDGNPTPPFDRLMLFIPNPAHDEWLFADHTPEEWSQGSASAIWDWKTNMVLYADGIHTEASLRATGQKLEDWLGIAPLPPS
jgi:hypothetical protein